MPAKKSTMLYRPFLREAWRLTWERKSLWIFGIFAALVSTGGVVDVVWRTLARVERTQSLLESLADTSFIGYRLASSYIGQLAQLGPERVSFIITTTTLLGLALIIMAILSQGALVLGLSAKTPKDPYELRRGATQHFWSLFVIGLLNLVLMLLLTTLMTLPLLLLSVSTAMGYVAMFTGLMCLFIPATISIHIVYLFALIDVVETGAHPLSAIHTGLQLFARQWLATLEYGVILFLLVFGAGLVLTIFIILLLVPLSAIYAAILLTGSYSFFLTFNIISALLILATLLAFAGAAVTFQYSAWYHFYKQGLHRVHGKKIFSKILRLAYR